MSVTLDLLSDTLHGTVEGYRAGCRGSACAGEVACRDVWRRFNGHWSFRKRVLAGETPAEIVASEAAEREAPLEREQELAAQERAAARAAAERARRAARSKTPRVRKSRPVKPQTILLRVLREGIPRLHAEGRTDQQMADELLAAAVAAGAVGVSVTRDKISHHRRKMGLPVNPEVQPNSSRPRRPVGVRAAREARIRELHARGCTDRVIADDVGLQPEAIRKQRRKLGLASNQRNGRPRTVVPA